MSGVASYDTWRIFAQAECRLGWGKSGHPQVIITNPDPEMCERLKVLLGASPEMAKEMIGTAEQPVAHMPVHMFRQLGILPPSLVEDVLYVMSAPEIPQTAADRAQRKHAQDIMKEAAATCVHGLLPDIRNMPYGRVGFIDGYSFPPSASRLSLQEKELSLKIAEWTARQAGADISLSGIPPVLEALHIHDSGAKRENVESRMSAILAQRDVKTAPSHIVEKGGQGYTYLSFGQNPNPQFLRWVTQELTRNGMESFVHHSAKFGGDVVAIPMTNDNSAKHYHWSQGPSSPIAGTLAEEEAWLKTLLPRVAPALKQTSTYLHGDSPDDGLIVDSNVVELEVHNVLVDVLKGNLSRQGITCEAHVADKTKVVVQNVARFTQLERHLGTDVQRAKEQVLGIRHGFAGREPDKGQRGGPPAR